jgi:hypothetical protein
MAYVYIISMEKDVERRENCKKILDTLNISYWCLENDKRTSTRFCDCFRR